MIRRIGAMAIIAAFVLLTGHSAEADNATALPQGKSFFEGTWVGKWQSHENPGDTKLLEFAPGTILKTGREGYLLIVPRTVRTESREVDHGARTGFVGLPSRNISYSPSRA